MTPGKRRALYWTPRILGILFVLFISTFALDVFVEGYGFWQTIGALAIHLVPSLLLAGALALAWRWEWIGAVLFFAFVAWYVVTGARNAIPWPWYVQIAGPPAVVGILFALNWHHRRELHDQA